MANQLILNLKKMNWIGCLGGKPLNNKCCQPACPDYFGELVEGGFITKNRVRQAHPDTLLIAEFVICNLSRLFGKSLFFFISASA